MLFLHLYKSVNKVTKFLMKSDYQNTIVSKIRKLRLSKNYSQQDISAILNISNGQIGNIETPSKSHKYTLAQLAILCDEFNISITSLFLEDIEGFSTDEVTKRLINSLIEYEK